MGNHEFDLNLHQLIPFLNGVDFPVLVSNLNNSCSHALWQTRSLKTSTIFNVRGHKVGVIGYLTPETSQISTLIDLEFLPEIDAIK